MPSPQHRAYQEGLRRWFRTHAHEADVEPVLRRHQHEALALYHIDLEPARAIVRTCYSPTPRGNHPLDPIMMLRCLMLAVLVGQPSINKWVADLEAQRVFRALVGLPYDADRPGVGTFYDFMHRLHDGPVRKTCEHVERPSESERRRARTARHLKRRQQTQKQKKKDKEVRAAKKLAPKKPEEPTPEVAQKVTDMLVEELQRNKDLDNPNDLLTRLAAILIDVAILPSAEQGLLGDFQQLVVSGDGSKLKTGANCHGKRTCDHPQHQHCTCDKLYSDPDAEWGWDNHREIWFFGYHFYEISCSSQEHDLPLALYIAPGNESDFTASLHTLDHLIKSMRARIPDWKPAVFVADAGHDAEAIHRYLHQHGIKAVIPLKAPARATHPTRPSVTLSPRAVPTCKAKVEMAHWGSAGNGRVNFICPVRANKLQQCPLAPEGQPDWHCCPNLHVGPTISVKTEDNHRLFPAIPRNSPRYAELYKLRSGCERSNAVKKETFKLEQARHRRASFWLIRLHLIAMLQHAKAWVRGEDADDFVDMLLGKSAEQAVA